MPAAEFFNQFGILTIRNFLDGQVCERLVTEMQKSRLIKGRHNGLESHRAVPDSEFIGPFIVAEPSAESVALLETAFLAQIPEFERYFKVCLQGIEPPGFAVYKKGGGFKPHYDVASKEGGYGAGRKVSAIIFLNQETAEPPPIDCYSGGNLTFYGLMKNPAFEKVGLPLTGERAMLVAFAPTILHEVTPVTFGERFVVAGWYI